QMAPNPLQLQREQSSPPPLLPRSNPTAPPTLRKCPPPKKSPTPAPAFPPICPNPTTTPNDRSKNENPHCCARSAPNTWTVWLGCDDRAPEGQRAPLAPALPPPSPLQPFPPPNCIENNSSSKPPRGAI